jgi:hypothetical protein
MPATSGSSHSLKYGIQYGSTKRLVLVIVFMKWLLSRYLYWAIVNTRRAPIKKIFIRETGYWISWQLRYKQQWPERAGIWLIMNG